MAAHWHTVRNVMSLSTLSVSAPRGEGVSQADKTHAKDGTCFGPSDKDPAAPIPTGLGLAKGGAEEGDPAAPNATGLGLAGKQKQEKRREDQSSKNLTTPQPVG